MNTRKVLAELVGTFLFLTIGYVSVANFGAAGVPPIIVVPFSFGLGLLAAIFAVGHVSGGHFNPAVTVAMILDKRTTPIDGAGYIVAQIIGAIAAAVVVLVTVNQAAVTAGVTKPGPGITDIGALILETIFTAAFLAVILGLDETVTRTRGAGHPIDARRDPFRIAALTGSSVNPARSIGSAVVGGDLNALWIYLVGPTLGGILGWGIWRVVDGGAEEAAPPPDGYHWFGLGVPRGRTGQVAGSADPTGPGAVIPGAGAGAADPGTCAPAPVAAATGSARGKARPPSAMAGSASQHAAAWPPPTSNSGGSSTRQRSNATGQRGWNRQPLGTCAASGVSPSRIVAFGTRPRRRRLG